jgi:hypothetical protein
MDAIDDWISMVWAKVILGIVSRLRAVRPASDSTFRIFDSEYGWNEDI